MKETEPKQFGRFYTGARRFAGKGAVVEVDQRTVLIAGDELAKGVTAQAGDPVAVFTADPRVWAAVGIENVDRHSGPLFVAEE